MQLPNLGEPKQRVMTQRSAFSQRCKQGNAAKPCAAKPGLSASPSNENPWNPPGSLREPRGEHRANRSGRRCSAVRELAGDARCSTVFVQRNSPKIQSNPRTHYSYENTIHIPVSESAVAD